MPPQNGGAPLQVIFHTSKHLAQMGHEVSILDSRYGPDDKAIEDIDGVKIIRLSFRKIPVPASSLIPRYLRFGLNELNAVLFALRASRYLAKTGKDLDIIHLNVTSVGLIVCLLNRKLRSRMFYTSHLGQWVLHGTKKLTLLEKAHVFFDALLMRRVAKVVALNELARDSFIAVGKVKPENVVVIPNGVDTQFFKPTIDVKEIKTKYDLEGKLSILFVGQLTKIKGVEHLVKAANAIINDFGHRDVVFVLVGPLTFGTLEKPVDMGEMLSYIRAHDIERNVLFTGHLPLDEVRMLYVAADIFVLPSLAEGDPLVVVEAMAAGKPIVGTKVGGIPHKIRDGWNGFLIDPANEQQLIEKIEYLIKNPEERKRMGVNSRKRAEEEFDWSSIAQRLSSVYLSELT
jgi:glycosyltransferase involved in cell wall biosynthesis